MGWKKRELLIVLENAHRADPDQLSELLELRWEAEFLASFLITERWIPQSRDSAINDPLNDVARDGYSIDLDPQIDMAEGVVLATAPSYSIDRNDRRWLKREIGEPPNLRRLRWYLDAWTAGVKNRRLAEIPKDDIYGKINSEILAKLQGGHRDTFIQVASILQFDQSFDSAVLDVDEVEELEKEKHITLKNGSFVIAHSSDAALIVEAFAKRQGRSVAAATAKAVLSYLSQSPPPRNCVSVINRTCSPLWESDAPRFPRDNYLNSLVITQRIP